MSYQQGIPNNYQYQQQLNQGMNQSMNQVDTQGTRFSDPHYLNQGYGGNPMQQYGVQPNHTFSVPQYQHPNMNYSMNTGSNPNLSYDFNPIDNVNYMAPIRTMGALYQGTYNMSNRIAAVQPLNIPQQALDNLVYFESRKKEKKQMNNQTETIKKNLQNDEDTFETRDERQKKMLLKFRGHLNKPPIEVYIPKSQYFNNRDRYFLEQLIMQPLKTNGIFGTQLVTDFDKSVMFEDKSALRTDAKRDNEDEYFETSMKDGIYLDYIKQIIYSYNIQKIEQRAAREGKKEWFRPNGDLRMDHDIFSDVITKPIDITLTPNEAFSTVYTNYSLYGRESNKSKKIYWLRILLSKLILKYHPQFSEEDILSNEIKDLHKEYYAHMNQLNIPYLQTKIKSILAKLDEYKDIHQVNPAIEAEKKNIIIFLDEATNYLDEEKRILNNKANQLYAKWLELKKLREKQKFQSTKLKLNVIRFNCHKENPNLFDYAFVLSNTNVTDEFTLLPRTEAERRAYSRNLKCQIIIYINGVKACISKPVIAQWPSYEVDFNMQYILKLLTRPAKMELELLINDKSITKFEAEPPGIFSKTVISSASLYEEVPFGNLNKEVTNDSDLLHKDNTLNDLDKEDEKEKLLQDNSQKEKEKHELNQPRAKEIEGIVLIKTEWEGRAPDLPPTKIEDRLELVNKQQDFQEKIKKYNPYYYPYDVNDPRNLACFDQMKKERLELVLKFLHKDLYLFNYCNVESLRHYLILKRIEKPSLQDLKFPILESEIESDSTIASVRKELQKTEVEKKDGKNRVEEGLAEVMAEYEKGEHDEKRYLELLSKKIKLMKKDIQQQVNLGYLQVLSEAELYANPALLCKEFFTRVFSRARKLAPLRIKPPPAKVEKTESIKINIHVIKAINVPIRNESHSTKIIDYQKLVSVNLRTTRNVLIKQSFDQNEMNYGSMNNSNVLRNSGTNHNSFNIGGMIDNNYNYQGTYGNNPNLNNVMTNLNNPKRIYEPNYMTTEKQDLLSLIKDLQQFEKRVNTFIQVKIKYYDQEKIMRTDSVDSIHPDYNHQFEFNIKPKDYQNSDKDKKVYFTREELSKCPGEFFFTLYDEIKKERVFNEKDATTLIQRYEKKYLGSFSIPFATVFQNASILDTVCKVNIPKTVFGYYSDSSSVFDVNNSDLINHEINQEPKQGVENLLPKTDYGNDAPEDGKIIFIIYFLKISQE